MILQGEVGLDDEPRIYFNLFHKGIVLHGELSSSHVDICSQVEFVEDVLRQAFVEIVTRLYDT